MSRARTALFMSIALLALTVSAEAEQRFTVLSGPGPAAAGGAVAQSGGHAHRRAPAPTAQFYTEPVWETAPPTVQIVSEAAPTRPIRPRSMNPVDPGATVSRTPAGYVVIGPPAGFVVQLPAAPSASAHPYAAPEFHMIGTPSSRHMDAPVKLTHGVSPPPTLRTGPKVVWLNEVDGASEDDAGGRIKRLR